mmetsp:Transcript_46731/g.130115  ORF Transcript_46731/g.130115 Transcript_46731/m.130115 type:complete len:217 (+) Transcript_46731:415-1065(+)
MSRARTRASGQHRPCRRTAFRAAGRARPFSLAAVSPRARSTLPTSAALGGSPGDLWSPKGHQLEVRVALAAARARRGPRWNGSSRSTPPLCRRRGRSDNAPLAPLGRNTHQATTQRTSSMVARWMCPAAQRLRARAPRARASAQKKRLGQQRRGRESDACEFVAPDVRCRRTAPCNVRAQFRRKLRARKGPEDSSQRKYLAGPPPWRAAFSVARRS